MSVLYTRKDDRLKLVVQTKTPDTCFVVYTQLEKLNDVYFYKIDTITMKKYSKKFNEFENCSLNHVLLNSIIQNNMRYLQHWQETRKNAKNEKIKWSAFIEKNKRAIHTFIYNSTQSLQKIKNPSLKKLLLYIQLWTSLGYELNDIPYYNKDDLDIRVLLSGILLLLEYKNI